MSTLDIDKDKMIELLLKDNKVNVVRNAILKNDYDSMIQQERLNYLTDEELYNLAKDEDELVLVMMKYFANSRLIDIIINDFIDYERVIKLFINKYMDEIMPAHLEKLIKYPKYKECIMDNIDKANKEATIFLHKNKMIVNTTQKQFSIILPQSIIDADLKTLNLNNICIVSYERKFTPEELEYAIEKIFATNIDLHMKGYIDSILQSQDVPTYYLQKMIKEWTYTPDELWFERLLKHQNLDGVIDYILDNYRLEKDTIAIILGNNKTSPKKLLRLYKDYFDLIVKIQSKALPVLDCHLHMC